jgi:plasmid stabilization system protein ParE
MKVVLTEEARRDLEQIGDYIARDNPTRAESFVRELIAKARQLGEHPSGFPLVPRYERLGIRRRAHGNYAIFYRVEADRVSVIHILHSARDYEALLFPEG